MIHQIQTKMGTVKLPCMEPVLVPIEKVQANNYNPNNVSSDNMRLLLQSILDNGFCFPVVTIYDDLMDKYVIIDGFHRYQIFRDYLGAKEIPVVDYVLARFNPDESQIMDETFERAAKACLMIVEDGFTKAMNQYNTK